MDYLHFLLDVLKFVAGGFDIASALLIALLLLAWYIIRQAEKPKNYWAGVFDDDSGKRSGLRVAVLICIAVSSAVLMYLAVNTIKTGDDLQNLFPFYVAFLLVWSGAKVAEKLIDFAVALIAAKFNIKLPGQASAAAGTAGA